MRRPVAAAFALIACLRADLVGQDANGAAWKAAAPWLERHCTECHGRGKELEGDLDLVARPFLADRRRTIEVLREMRSRVAEGEMPPEDHPHPPTPEVKATMLRFLDERLREVAAAGLDPGRVTMRRLSRAEYANVVRDLFGVRGEITRGFPADDLGFGFDNIGAASTFSVLHFEKYAAAAERVARAALGLAEVASTRRVEAENLDLSRANPSVHAEWLCLCSGGPALFTFEARQAGRYALQVRAAGQAAGGEAPQLVVTLDGARLLTRTIAARAKQGELVELEFECGEGRHELGFDFPNDYWNPNAKDPEERDRNLLLDWVSLAGPKGTPRVPSESAWILAADPGAGSLAERARPVVTELLRRTWRRPPSAAEVERSVGLVVQHSAPGASFAAAIATALEAALVSPHFLFRAEPGIGRSGAGSEPLDGLALATRLSFFLWSSTPDPALLERGSSGGLDTADAVRAEAKRMLADGRAEALARNFAAQWLELRLLDQVAPDRKRFPTWSRELRRDMREETELLFLAVLREQRDVRELLAPSFAFLNERLAAHYGIPGVKGRELRAVPLEDARFGGLLAQASILTVTSNPTRTSPVKRGKWVLENILDQAPPPPPPGNDSFQDEKRVQDASSLREQLAVHRKDPACATCHVRMDALGLALESFDPIGRWRAQDAGKPIDTTGTLPDGRKLQGVADLKRVLRDDPAFVRCLLEKLFVYAVGRGAGPDDEILLDAVARDLPREKVTLHDLVLAIVGSDPFRTRKKAP